MTRATILFLLIGAVSIAVGVYAYVLVGEARTEPAADDIPGLNFLVVGERKMTLVESAPRVFSYCLLCL